MPIRSEDAVDQLVVAADLRLLGEVRAWVRERAQTADFSAQDLGDIDLAVTEAVSNVIRHAYGEDSHSRVSIRAGRKGAGFVISIHDTGPPFLGVARAEVDASRAGGYGLRLISTVMDDATWTRLSGGRNELRLLRRCPTADA